MLIEESEGESDLGVQEHRLASEDRTDGLREHGGGEAALDACERDQTNALEQPGIVGPGYDLIEPVQPHVVLYVDTNICSYRCRTDRLTSAP